MLVSLHVNFHNTITFTIMLHRTDDENILCAEISEFTMALPDPTSYCDITNPHQLPNVTMQNITNYLQGNDKMFDDNYKKLYEET